MGFVSEVASAFAAAKPTVAKVGAIIKASGPFKAKAVVIVKVVFIALKISPEHLHFLVFIEIYHPFLICNLYSFI